MILKELSDLYRRLEQDPEYQIAPRGFSLQKITFKVVLQADGRLFAIQDARQPRRKALVPVQIKVPGNAKSSGSGLNPCFLWDNTMYMLGFTPDKSEDKKRKRAPKCFQAFRRYHLELKDFIDSPRYRAVCTFLESWNPERAGDHAILAEVSTGFGVFQIQGESAYVHEDPAVLSWWNRRDSEDAPEAICLIDGIRRPIARIHDKIKGVKGGQPSGGTIVGFNDDAYVSYGAKQSYNAPVGRDAAFRYVTALNALLDGPMSGRHRFVLGDTTVAFWTERSTEVEQVLVAILGEGSRALAAEGPFDEGLLARIAAYLKKLRRGADGDMGLGSEEAATGYTLLGLAPNAGRISIRFHLRGTLGQLLENQRAHFRDIGLQSTDRVEVDPDEFPPVRRLLDEICPLVNGKPDRDRMPPIHIGPLMRAIIENTRYPEGFYQAILGRIRADRKVRRIRAAIIKGYLIRNRGKEVSMSLDVQNTDVAYRLGRLFATLEKTQSDALGSELNATIRDRFYGSASAAPRTAFPRLMRTYQHHLAKLPPGLRINREILVQQIMDAVTGFPPRFDLTEQGMFALGYYHQKSSFYRKTADDHVNAKGTES